LPFGIGITLVGLRGASTQLRYGSDKLALSAADSQRKRAWSDARRLGRREAADVDHIDFTEIFRVSLAGATPLSWGDLIVSS
jgi:hypothetical protein